ncbi:reverse transcriptase (RNA-dependent DNA polymerase) [Hirsutella rhossiliensis]
MKIYLTKPLPERSRGVYRNPHHLDELLRKTIQDYLDKGFIESCWPGFASPAFFVPKGDMGMDWRFVIDYRDLNDASAKMKYPMPLLEDTLVKLASAKFFTKIDIRQAFHRLRMALESMDLTAFRCRLGTFRWKVMPFGLTNGPAIFQCFINDCLRDILDIYCSSYADDILIYSESAEENVRQTEEVIRRLAAAGLQGDIKKSSFCVTEVDYLGLVIKAGEGIALDPKKKQAILEWRLSDLKSTKAIRSFLGLVNFVRRFSKEVSELAHPLNELLKRAIFKIGKQEEAAFEALKEALVRAPGMGFWKIGAPTRIETDASKHSVGATALQQQNDNSWKPVAYFSKTLSSTETVWPIQDREFLAIIRALEEWRPELVGGPFEVVTDHEALKYFATKRVLSSRQARWAQILSEFDYKMTYRPGKENIIADALSRKSENFETVRARDLDSRTMELVPNDRVPAEVLEETHVEAAPLDIAANSEDRGPAVPGEAPAGVFLVELIVRENEKQIPKEDRRKGDRIWVPDPRTQIKGSSGKNKMKAMLRPFYYWPHTAERLAKRYYRRVFGHLGLPKIWLSDNGPQFISKFMAKVNEMTGTEHKFGSAYHAQTQGGVEITNQYLDQRLTFYVSYFQDDWSMTPIEASQGRAPHAAFVHIATDKQERSANLKRRVPDFDVGDWVIVAKRGHSFELDLPKGMRVAKVLHADRLRRAARDPLPGQQVEAPPAEMINGEPEYEVAKILSSRISRGKLQYRAEWAGQDPDELYYDAEGFKNGAAALRRFHDEYPEAPGPPVRLAEWLLAAAEDRWAESHNDDNKAVGRGHERRRLRRHS